MRYEDYIQSKDWRLRRSAYFSTYSKKCVACGSWKNIHLHHHTYARLGEELDQDMVPLCEDCHKLVHAQHVGTKKSLTMVTIEVVRTISGDGSFSLDRIPKKHRRIRPFVEWDEAAEHYRIPKSKHARRIIVKELRRMRRRGLFQEAAVLLEDAGMAGIKGLS
jgi:phage terminase large subunit GpA-like protein